MLNCSIKDIFENTIPLWNIDNLYNYRYIHKHCAIMEHQ